MQQRNTAAVPPQRRNDSKVSPRPNMVLGAGGSVEKVPQLLQQMELMMKSWSRPMQSTMDKKSQMSLLGSGGVSQTQTLDAQLRASSGEVNELGGGGSTAGIKGDHGASSPNRSAFGSSSPSKAAIALGYSDPSVSPPTQPTSTALVVSQNRTLQNVVAVSDDEAGGGGAQNPPLLGSGSEQTSALQLVGGEEGKPTQPSSGIETYVFEEELQEKVQMLEGCRSILGLFAAGSGPYQGIMSKLFLYLFDLVESLIQEVGELQEVVNEGAKVGPRSPDLNMGGSLHQPRDNSTAGGTEAFGQGSSENPRTDEDFKRIDYAFGKLRRTEEKMASMVVEATQRENILRGEIEALKTERTKLQELLEFQAMRAKRDRVEQALHPDDHRKRMMETVTILDLENQIEKLKKERREAYEEQRSIRDDLADSQMLNSKYAQQAMQMASRVRVYQEQNERFATLLSMQYDERAATERENELLRSELVDLNKFHQLRHNLEGESGKIATQAELRVVRYTFGTSQFVPRHLHFSKLMNRITLPRDAALTLVADLLNARGSQGRRSDFQTFIHNFLTKKHAADAVAWAYSLDEACRLNDADVNLNIFSLVSRRQLPEELYTTLHTDISIFLEACEAIDQMQHGELKLTVPVAHVLGILIELFPSYQDGAFRMAMEQLQTTLTTNAHAHYRLLFPNLEREGGVDSDAFAHIDVRVENNFSTTFKELIVDDCVVTTQQVEDDLLQGDADRVTLGELTKVLINRFGAEAASGWTGRQCRRVMKDVMKQGQYEMSVPKFVLVQALREKVVLRRGIMRSDPPAGGEEEATSNNSRLEMANQAMGEWAEINGDELIKVNYREVIQVTETRRQMDQVNDEQEFESDESDMDIDDLIS